MRLMHLVIGALIAAGAGATASAGTCRTDGGQTCPSAMPLGGYCECNVHGRNVGGDIVSDKYERGTAKSFQPDAPGAAPEGRRPPPPGYAPPPPGYPPPPPPPPPGY